MKKDYKENNNTRVVRLSRKKIELFLLTILGWSAVYTLLYYNDSLVLKILLCLNITLFIMINVLLKTK